MLLDRRRVRSLRARRHMGPAGESVTARRRRGAFNVLGQAATGLVLAALGFAVAAAFTSS